jgi:transcriptional regulator with XRE-family HTH domain
VETNIPVMRDEKELSVSELARRTGINKGHLSEIERGIRIPTNDQVSAIARVLGGPVWVWVEVPPR